MYVYFILSLVGTLMLLYALRALTTVFNIKYRISSSASVILGLLFIGCATYLSSISPIYMFVHGGIISLFIMFFSSTEENLLRKLINGFLAFLFWPQFVCLIIFIFYYANQISNE